MPVLQQGNLLTTFTGTHLQLLHYPTHLSFSTFQTYLNESNIHC